MKILKKMFPLAAALILVLLAASCNSSEKRVNAAAESFLKAYYSADYEAAAGFCTPEFSRIVNMGAKAQQAVPEETAQKMKEAVAATSFRIVSSQVDKEAASALVRCEVIVPALEKPVPKLLKLKLEGRTALVDGIE